MYPYQRVTFTSPTSAHASYGTGQPPAGLSVPNFWKTLSPGTLTIEFSAEHPHTVPPRWNTLRLVLIAVRPDTTHGFLERYSLILFDFDDASIPSIQQPSLDVIRSYISSSPKDNDHWLPRSYG
jgi:hypothetical protein